MPYLISCVMATSVLKLCSVSGGPSSSAPEEELPGERWHEGVPGHLQSFSLRHQRVPRHLSMFPEALTKRQGEALVEGAERT